MSGDPQRWRFSFDGPGSLRDLGNQLGALNVGTDDVGGVELSFTVDGTEVEFSADGDLAGEIMRQMFVDTDFTAYESTAAAAELLARESASDASIPDMPPAAADADGGEDEAADDESADWSGTPIEATESGFRCEACGESGFESERAATGHLSHCPEYESDRAPRPSEGAGYPREWTMADEDEREDPEDVGLSSITPGQADHEILTEIVEGTDGPADPEGISMPDLRDRVTDTSRGNTSRVVHLYRKLLVERRYDGDVFHYRPTHHGVAQIETHGAYEPGQRYEWDPIDDDPSPETNAHVALTGLARTAEEWARSGDVAEHVGLNANSTGASLSVVSRMTGGYVDRRPVEDSTTGAVEYRLAEPGREFLADHGAYDRDLDADE